jgi:hypothetical protein
MFAYVLLEGLLFGMVGVGLRFREGIRLLIGVVFLSVLIFPLWVQSLVVSYLAITRTLYFLFQLLHFLNLN